MFQVLLYWLAASVVIAACFSLLRGVEKAMRRQDDATPENDEQIRARMDAMRIAWERRP